MWARNAAQATETSPAPLMCVELTMPNLIPIQDQLLQTDPIFEQIIFPSMLEILQKHWKSVAETTFDPEVSRLLSDYHSNRLDAFPWNILFHHIHGWYNDNNNSCLSTFGFFFDNFCLLFFGEQLKI